MLALKENLDILQNEQQILSQELTLKQNEVLKSKKDLTNAESELVQLRPLKDHLKSLNNEQLK